MIKLNAARLRTHINELWKLNMKMYKTPTRMRRQAHVHACIRRRHRERERGKEKERGQVDPCLVSRAQITLQIDGSNTHKSKPKERSQVGCNQKGRKEGAWLTTLSQMQRSKDFLRIE